VSRHRGTVADAAVSGLISHQFERNDMHNVRRALVGVTAGALALGLISAAPAMAIAPAGDVPSELRNFPYCELIPDTVANGIITEHVFNTLGFNTCPSDTWETITEQNVIDAYNAQYGSTGLATSATINGRRHWVLDSIKSGGGVTSSSDTLTVNGMELGLKGLLTTPVGDATIGTNAYEVNTVQRNTTYLFKKGRKIYQLIDPDGNVYVMQSYTTQMAPLTLKKLDRMGRFLDLPEGWRYRVVKLDKDLNLTASGSTQIVNDKFRNTYQVNPAAKVK
jgi:hypothetical protein